MIFLKLFLILFISYNINTAYAFTDSAVLKKVYLESAQKMNEVGLSICKLPKERWAGVCYNVLKKLREDDMYKYKVFVNYEAFSKFNESSEWKCMKQEFFFESSLEKIARSRPLEQEMLPCFSRPAFVKPNKPYDKYEYYDEFTIFPASKKSVHVFKRIPQTRNFYLLETYKHIIWSDDNMKVPPELFTLPPPQMINTFGPGYLRFLIEEDLLSMSSDAGNVINRANNKLYLLIRNTLMKFFMKDRTTVHVCNSENTTRNQKTPPQINHLRIFHPNAKEVFLKDVRTYGCPIRNSEGTVKPTYHWKIAAATTPDSVFILHRVPYKWITRKKNKVPCDSGNTCHSTNQTPYRLVALVQNLNPDYILFII